MNVTRVKRTKNDVGGLIHVILWVLQIAEILCRASVQSLSRIPAKYRLGIAQPSLPKWGSFDYSVDA